MDAARSQARLRDGEPLALPPEQVGGGHPHVLERDLALAGAADVAEHRHGADDANAGRVGGSNGRP